MWFKTTLLVITAAMVVLLFCQTLHLTAPASNNVDYSLQHWLHGRTFAERKETVLKLVSMGWNPAIRRLRQLFIDTYWRKPSVHVSGGWHTEWYGPTDEKVFVRPFVIDAQPVSNEEYWTFLKLSGYVPREGKEAYWFLEEMLGEMPQDLSQLWDEDPNRARATVLYAEAPFDWGSFEDNQAFAKWVGMRMPTQPEWEMACESGLRYGESDILPGLFCVRSPAPRKEE